MNCFKCGIELKDLKINYDIGLIIIKGILEKVCDKCKEQYFDDEASENIKKNVNKLKDLSTEITVINYKESVD